ncbi:chorismate mutase / prephenate dehydrogenase [Campylobacter insulaenigrae]|uniref:prephenate dehydrogenase n=1 Tax=Campylobacter insulaenigrae NCTC 12927 TaxID=1031564 RepID=A0A0A8H098_9BACT|nr:chorismate mutase / prephenate dehydrogenase [Campylobacter insulaenigrae]AJC87210.1 chorismate mutase / prephenate dehydrogenase [Campylobacter insulaenigrae NCTC 12927]MCR6571017.1 chorismate mutase / prephenate dehydrogenase [Campylobacter insulaenigrae]MCR6574487.1 chorismate mutase / prephenate dehydrogenase [Campylobacter insulaenigrae]MCR6576084.1 chorismate mutase / prephenate dehydrogenase [Campylobacter insulaenigrae]MCR6577603.1 chorismate mutase / prephenate dehydrogenase [Campy
MDVGIVGLGLMGGSLGLSLRENKMIDMVYGYDINKDFEKIAAEKKLVDKIVNFEQIKRCDVIVLAVPVNAIIEILKDLEDTSQDCTIIELGSTKEEISKHLTSKLKQHFIAAHPMAGTENSGPNAAIRDLYKNAVCILCDTQNAAHLHQKRAIEIFSDLGMKIIFMDSLSHDHHTAIISHLPHVISFSLANFVMKEENKKNITHLGGPSFKDMCRIAKSNPKMWSGIFQQNKQNLLNSIEMFQKELQECKKMIEKSDVNELEAWIKDANKLREIL